MAEIWSPHCQLYAPAALRRSQRTETAVAGNRAAGFALARVPILPKMFLVEEADAGAICVLFAEQGELSYAVELRRRFPAITSNAKAREYVRTIAGSKPLPHSVARGGLPGHPFASVGVAPGPAKPIQTIVRAKCARISRPDPDQEPGLATGKRLVVVLLAPLQWLRFRQEVPLASASRGGGVREGRDEKGSFMA